ncbi:Stk1 family PASTA domain-containing Ser/Thr kinase [Parasphingorhabdus pacifica]
MTPETRPGHGSNLVGAMLERRYRVDSLIARGGMSAVYRGLDTRLQRPVALKVMDAQYSGDRSFVDRFVLEARSAASLHHPNVVAVYDQGVDREAEGDHVFLVMQLVEGCTLRDLILDRGSLPLPLALSVLTPMLSALGAAHNAGMVHRDIKPENVLIGTDGSVQVADFGLVRAAASAGTTSGSVILGTVAYLSPEQVTTGAADARTDLYAAGVVLYEMLTGRPPYTGDTALSVAYRHVNDDVPAPSEQAPELPGPVDDLVVHATRREPSARPESAEAFLAEVEAVRDVLDLKPVPVPVPAGDDRTAEMLPADLGDEPPTERFPQVGTSPMTTSDDEFHSTGGPRGTRAMRRPVDDAEQTQNLSAVEAAEPEPRAARAPAQEQQRRRSRRKFAVVTLAVLLLAGLIGGTAWWLGNVRSVEVPTVVGKSESVARDALVGAELTPRITREYHNSVPDGTVISSSPGQGSHVSTGEEVELVVSQGRPQVPSIAEGASVEEAERVLRDTKLRPRLDEAANQYHPTVPEGKVLGVSPEAGSRVEISSEVTVVLSKGPEPVPVPDVTGASKEQAFAALREAGFEPHEAARKFDSDVPRDHVISTTPSPGTEVQLVGRPKVGVVVSNAVTVPDLNGVRLVEAERQIAELGLKLKVRSLFNRENGLVLGQFPLAGSKVEPGSTVHVNAI